MKLSSLKMTKALGAFIAAIAAGLVFFDKLTMDQLTGMITAIGVVFGAVYGIESKNMKNNGE